MPNFADYETLANGLRDQGLADLVAARLAFRLDEFTINGKTTLLAHAVVSKCQQASEKLWKGYFLVHDPSFDPTKGHMPLTDRLDQFARHRPVRNLLSLLDRHHKGAVAELKRIEKLAPNPPEVPDAEKGKPVSLTRVQRNSEYPFWSDSKQQFLTPAEDFTQTGDGLRALRLLQRLCHALSRSEPAAYTRPIEDFLDAYPWSESLSSPS